MFCGVVNNMLIMLCYKSFKLVFPMPIEMQWCEELQKKVAVWPGYQKIISYSLGVGGCVSLMVHRRTDSWRVVGHSIPHFLNALLIRNISHLTTLGAGQKLSGNHMIHSVCVIIQ